MEICKENECTACGACYNICPTGAITMSENKRGFKYPIINDNRCVICGNCRAVCPGNFPTKDLVRKPYECYAAWNKEKIIRFNSSSGGIVSAIGKFGLEKGYKIAGVQWNHNWEPIFCLTDKAEDLERFRGSKYVQCNTGMIFKDIKDALETGEKVIFFGTPCQAAALRTFTQDRFKNLIVVDFVCHGIPPYKMFREYLFETIGSELDSISSIKMRYKYPCWNYGSVRIELEREVLYSKKTIEDIYYNLFNFNYSLRESCYNCHYACEERVGDITVCDFWGYKPYSAHMLRYRKGVSGVLVNSDMGRVVFRGIQEDINFESSTLDSLKKGNSCLSSPVEIPDDCDMFWKDYSEGTKIKELHNKYITKPYEIPTLYPLRLIRWSLIDIKDVIVIWFQKMRMKKNYNSEK